MLDLLIFGAWFISGVVGTYLCLCLAESYRKHIVLGNSDIVFSILFSLLGPLMIVIWFVVFIARKYAGYITLRNIMYKENK